MMKLGALIVALSCYSLSVSAFTVRSHSPRQPLALRVANNKETLIFSVEYTVISDPVPADRKEDFLQLFETNEICLSLLSSGGKRKAEEGTLTPVFESYWDEMSQKTKPNFMRKEDSRLFLTDTDSKFPGITLFSTVCNGCNLLRDAAGRPKYEFLLLAEKQTVQGAAPVVWLFNKLTGKSKEAKDEFLKTTNEVRSVTSIVESGDSVALQFVVDAKIYVVFPKSLMKILPASKEKMEEQGSASMRSTIVKDVDDAVAGALQSFLLQKALTPDQ